jgi:hypothetical protein
LPVSLKRDEKMLVIEIKNEIAIGVIAIISVLIALLYVKYSSIKNLDLKGKIMTDESKTKLAEITELMIKEKSKAIDEVRLLLKKNEKISEFMAERNLPFDLDGINHILEYRMFIGILLLDLCSATRIYLNAKSKYETIYSARHIVVIINEGYKKIHYQPTKE